MSLQPIATVKAALITAIKSITTANGYANTIDPTHLKDRYDQAFLSNMKDDLYPKFCLFSHAGTQERLPGLERKADFEFNLIIITKQIGSTDTPGDEKAESLLADFMDLFYTNDTLGGVVQDVSITDFLLDGGVLAPEGAALVRLKTEGFQYS